MSIRELIEAVEAGREVTVGMVRKVFPDIALMDLVFIVLRPNDIRAEGAALALMRAVLPEWGWTLEDNGDAILWAPNDASPPDDAVVACQPGNPARALLLAILKAKLAEMEGRG